MAEFIGPLRTEIERVSQQIFFYFNPALPAKNGQNASPTRDWPMVKGEVALSIAFGYLLFVAVASFIMRFRKSPVGFLKTVQYFYNPLQVIVCSWMCLEAGRQVYRQPHAKVIDNDYRADRTDIANVLWAFYVSKILDFLDTVFIILGKKSDKQLSFLHVYHHWSIFLTYWMIINAGYDGDIYLTIVLNTFVHVVMYLYYMITGLGLWVPEDPKQADAKDPQARAQCKPYSPWWKHFITKLQMLQFLLMNAQAIYLIVNNGQYPVRITWFYLFYIQSLFWLFYDFSRKSYGGKKEKKDKKTQ